MSNEDQQHSANGLMMWLSTQFGGIQMKLGELQAQTAGNRQTLVQVYQQLTHRMDRMEDRMANGHRRLGFLKHVPYVKITILLIITLLLVTGHMTVAELKAYLAKRLLD